MPGYWIEQGFLDHACLEQQGGHASCTHILVCASCVGVWRLGLWPRAGGAEHAPCVCISLGEGIKTCLVWSCVFTAHLRDGPRIMVGQSLCAKVSRCFHAPARFVAYLQSSVALPLAAFLWD